MSVCALLTCMYTQGQNLYKQHNNVGPIGAYEMCIHCHQNVLSCPLALIEHKGTLRTPLYSTALLLVLIE